MLTSGPPQTNSMIMSTLMKHSFKEVSSQKNLNLGEKFMFCIKNGKQKKGNLPKLAKQISLSRLLNFLFTLHLPACHPSSPSLSFSSIPDCPLDIGLEPAKGWCSVKRIAETRDTTLPNRPRHFQVTSLFAFFSHSSTESRTKVLLRKRRAPSQEGNFSSLPLCSECSTSYQITLRPRDPPAQWNRRHIDREWGSHMWLFAPWFEVKCLSEYNPEESTWETNQRNAMTHWRSRKIYVLQKKSFSSPRRKEFSPVYCELGFLLAPQVL